MFLAVLFALGLLLSFNRSAILFAFFVAFLFVLQFIQVSSIVYFGYPLQSSEVYKIAEEFSDILRVAISEADALWLIPFSVVLPFGFIITAHEFLKKHTVKFPFAFMLVLLIFVPKIARTSYRDAQFFFPSPVRYSFHNSINTASYYIGREIWLNERFRLPNDFYSPYSVSIGTPKARNIFLVIGESVNPKHLSLFGYERKTTPFLDSMKHDKMLDFQEAIASGVATHSSLTFLLNGVREPGNLKEIRSKTFNLFRLAKQQGFSTFFISAQDAKNAYEIGSNYVDKVVTREEKLILFSKRRDSGLISILNGLHLSDKNFIVVQMRTPHAPYQDNYDKKSEFDVFHGNDRRTDTYDNAVLYFDAVMNMLFSFYKSHARGPSWFVFVSDHGQAFGDNGFFGHNKLDMSIATIPFISVGPGKIPVQTPSHYEISNWIAQLLGYEFVNPNEKSGIFYVHGNNFLSDYEFIEYDKNNGKIVREEKTMLSNFVRKKR